ncbi:MAG: hypothetical protein KDK91_08885, partial [Gammaproteobacteria bacterium]|nr:hypothetical protein [Gammaproteobacteria bacterium]
MIRVFRHYIPSWIVVLCLVEAGLLFIAAYVGATWRVGEFNPSDKLMVGALWPRAVFWSVTMLLLLTGVGLYQPDLRDDLRGIWFRLTVAFLVGVVLITLVLSIAPSWSLGPGGLSAVVSASLLGVGSIRSALHLFADSELSRRRILVLGAGEVAREVEKLRRRADWRGLQLLGFVQLAGEQVSVSTRPVYPHDGELSTICANMRVDELVVAVDEESTPVPVGEVLDCKVRGIQVTDLIGFFEQRTGKIKVDSLKPSQVIFADGFVQAALKSTLHRVFDITVSSMMLVALSWLMLLTALLIRLESKRG